ncbi:MAG: DUF3887 domain-containing protein, partial [Pedobacter sp.]|nr:DUF3887 domain-containing protein [Pedobacter sp.]
MKKTILLFFILLSTTSAFSQGMLNLFGKTEDFFALMSEEKYTEAYVYFDASFQAKVPATKLQEMWTSISEKLGKLQTVNILSSKLQGDLFVLSVEGKFANDGQNFTIAYNKTEKIVGLFLQPKSPSMDYIKPSYADTTLYSEKEIYVTTEKHKLVGILTTPKKAVNYPLVVLVHGSGPSDMD